MSSLPHNLNTYLNRHRHDLSRLEHSLVVTGLHLDPHLRVVAHIEAHPLGAFERQMPGVVDIAADSAYTA
jgi:hypothetical protein